MILDGKTVIITGAASGFGKALAERLSQSNARIVLADVNDAAGIHLKNQLNAIRPDSAVYYRCDVTRKSDLFNLFKYAKDHFGSVDVVCNNAGITENVPFADNIQDNWLKVVDIDLISVIYGTRLAIEYFRKQGSGGVVINTASLAGLIPSPIQPVYAAVKAGVVNFTRSLDFLKSEGIRVNAICPSYVKTGITESAKDLGFEITDWLPIDLVIDAFIQAIENENLAGMLTIYLIEYQVNA
ncbi:hypothetical protein HDV02_004156 [Globomyces sp. JEL0801]|nr:hypothetical protein HDV02_004156 [Globomyces sp. JEL0801]